MNNALLIGSIVGGALVLLAGGFYGNKKMENDRLDREYNNWTARGGKRMKRNAKTRKSIKK